MSRCFPFPPPGYEKEARTEDPDLLKKEKQREKKHKKEKKEKEKRESKEKKDKDRSDEKHKEKKDKKEKHQDKKKEKDRDKDKAKRSYSDEKRLSAKSEGHDGDKTSNEKKFLGKSEGHKGEKFSQEEKEKEKDKYRSSYSGDKKVAGKLSGYSGEKLGQNNYLAGDTKDSMFLQRLGRVGDDDRATETRLVEKFAGTERKRDEEMVKLVAKATVSLDEGNEKKGDDRKLDEQVVKDEPRFRGNVMVQNLAGMVQTRVEGTPRSLKKDVESRTEGKEKTKQKEGDDKLGDKRKQKEREKNGQGKEKEKKKEKEKMKSEHKNIEKDNLRDSNKDDIIGMNNMKTFHLQKDSDKAAISEGNPRKRKEYKTNGFFHANDIKPNKLSRPTSSLHPLTDTNKVPRPTSSSIDTDEVPKPTSSSHPVTETNKVPRPTYSLSGNGRILEPCQTSALFTSDSKGAAINLKADSKECKVYGIIVSQPLSVSPVKPIFATAQADQIAEVYTKPPHPDTKYLSQILLLPEVEEWSDFDDQEWLFQSSNSQFKKPNSGSIMNDEMPHIWAEAMRIESADVCALPYVIPY